MTDASKGGSIRRLATLVNSRNRLGKTIIAVVLSKHDPKYLELLNISDDLAMIAKNISQYEIDKQQLMAHKTFHGEVHKKTLSIRKQMKLAR